jgi:hypothetical protein
MSSLIPSGRGTLVTTRAERAAIRRAADVQAELFHARAVDMARRERATGRMADLASRRATPSMRARPSPTILSNAPHRIRGRRRRSRG